MSLLTNWRYSIWRAKAVVDLEDLFCRDCSCLYLSLSVFLSYLYCSSGSRLFCVSILLFY